MSIITFKANIYKRQICKQNIFGYFTIYVPKSRRRQILMQGMHVVDTFSMKA